MKISFEVGGRKLNPDNLADALMAAVLHGVEESLRARVGSIRDPETGEFPVLVVRGRDLENLSIEVEGSERLVALVKERLGGDEAEGGEASGPERDTPVAFLCHGSEDKATVRRLAEDLLAAGIDVFFDEWEIRSGDSLRRKIDDGLGRCTHFISSSRCGSACRWPTSRRSCRAATRPPSTTTTPTSRPWSPTSMGSAGSLLWERTPPRYVGARRVLAYRSPPRRSSG